MSITGLFVLHVGFLRLADVQTILNFSDLSNGLNGCLIGTKA